MSELGQPREPLWTKEDDDFLRKNSHYMTVKELAKCLNRTEPSIRNRKYVLGVRKGNCIPFSNEEKRIIKEWYTKDIGVDLDELSKLLNRPKTSVSMIAGRMGLTRYGNYSEKRRKECGEQIRKVITSIEHPRGMLGKHHTQEAKEKMSAFHIARAANMTYEEKHEIAMKALETKKRTGTYMNTTSNAYSRTKSGKRKDLDDAFFRSAWEANIARILNYLNIEWEYEPKRFFFNGENLSVDSYQPDFYLPKLNKWIEVKGWMDEKSKARLKYFQEQYPEQNENLILINQDFYILLRYKYFYLPNWEDYSKFLKPYRKNYFERLDEKQLQFLEDIFEIKKDGNDND